VDAGYSGTPLAKKLGIAEDVHVAALHAPAELNEWLAPLPAGAVVQTRLAKGTQLVLVFVTERSQLATVWADLTTAVGPFGTVWVCWPKRSSGVTTDITEDVVRELTLRTGWVDVKVCAVSDVWSGLKHVLRKELRPHR
jgi:hypothetical protein